MTCPELGQGVVNRQERREMGRPHRKGLVRDAEGSNEAVTRGRIA